MSIASSDKGSTGGGGDLTALQQLLAAGGGTTDSGRVYMGEYSKYRAPKGASAQARKNIQELSSRELSSGHTGSLWLSKGDAEQAFYTWDAKKQSDFLSQAIVGGLLKLGDGPLEAGKLWKKLVDEAALYGAANKKVSPMDLMSSYVKAAGGGNAWTSAGVWQINTVTGERKYAGPGTYLGSGKAQQVDTRVDLTDPDTAKAVATKLFQDLMGRDPGAGELTTFATALHSAEQANPVVQTTTTQYDMDTGQPVSSSTSSSGGVDASGQQYIGEQQVKGKKEYGAYQAATTYQNALDSLVFGSGS
ncbi:hypothetical protein [Streptomyces misionensis]|uniref:hypothetical protein n=1 Tax=Streptomyces misionensis TaxID=67331 RepID=UPI00368951B4